MIERFLHHRQHLIAAGLACLAVLVLAVPVLADATLWGYCRVPEVKGRTSSYVMLKEWNIWMSKDGDSGWIGQSWRTNMTGWPSGYYTFPALSSPPVGAGSYSLYLDEPVFWGRPTVVGNVNMPSSGSVHIDVELPCDYSCRYPNTFNDWGSDPWTPWFDEWYQTFKALGTSITGVTTHLAGHNASGLQFTFHESNGGPVTTWPQVGPARNTDGIANMTDLWVRYRSGDVPTVPGRTYALKWTGLGSGAKDFAVFRRLDEDGSRDGYADGRAYDKYGNPKGYDLFAVILADNDGTVVSYCALEYEGGANTTSYAPVWGQTLKAIGGSLAGVTVFYSDNPWDRYNATFRVKSGGPTGPYVGPAKTSRPASMAASSAFYSASWNRSEVPLAPGQTYYIEISSPEINPHRFVDAINQYPYGDAYRNGVLQPGMDLFMQVVEHVDPSTISVTPPELHPTAPRRNDAPDDTLYIRNSGGGILAYTITDNVSWLSVQPDKGDVYGDQVDAVTVSYETSALPMGSYTGTITITAPGATNTPTNVTVHLTITAPLFAPCDFEPDGDVDQGDYGVFQGCYTLAGGQYGNPICAGADMDGDLDVDAADLAKFMNCLSGPNVPANTVCAE